MLLGVSMLLNTLWVEMTARNVWVFAASVVALIISVVLDVIDHPGTTELQAWLYLAILAAFLAATVPPVFRLGRKDNPNLTQVCLLSALVITVALVGGYVIFYRFFPAPQAAAGYDRILNLPPVLVAIWAAGMGWYVHYHVSQRNARTKNAFDLVMQTRTSAEYQKSFALVTRFYPFGSTIPPEDGIYFKSDTIKKLSDELQDAKQATGDNKKKISEIEYRLERANAILSLKSVLNYFEFMAVGLAKRDLDEQLLYDTIGVTVVSIYDRAKTFIEHVQGDGQCLAYSSLAPLVKEWRRRIHAEEAVEKCKQKD